MSKTRDDAFKVYGRQRSTTSICRGGHEQGGHSSATDVMWCDGFPGGSLDPFLLVSFEDHIILRLWEGEVRMKYYG